MNKLQDVRLSVFGITAIIGAAAGAAACLIFAGKAGVRNKIERATIYLDLVNGKCQITTNPQTIQACKKQTVEWTIVDRCGVTQPADVEVEVIFGDYDPFEVTCPKKGKKKIKCKIKDDAPVGSYKYDVMAGTALREDPELEIVQ